MADKEFSEVSSSAIYVWVGFRKKHVGVRCRATATNDKHPPDKSEAFRFAISRRLIDMPRSPRLNEARQVAWIPPRQTRVRENRPVGSGRDTVNG